MNKEPQWYGLEVLPVYVRLSRKQLKESRQQLENLEASEPNSNLFSTPIIDRLLKGIFEQNHSVWVFEEQCKRWNQASPSEDQLKDLIALQKNVEALKINNEKLLILVKAFRDQNPSDQ